jgi:uncharacterized protein
MRNKKIQYLLLSVVLIALVFAFIVFPMINKTESKSGRITTSKTAAEVPFTQEGVLSFLNDEGDTLKTIAIEIADNNFETTRGLMDRSTMSDNQGMLFIFPDNTKRSFWMKNTRIALDIMYVTEDLRVESIQKNAVPFSEASLPSRGKAKYVVEVNAGFSDVYRIQEGTRVVFERN